MWLAGVSFCHFPFYPVISCARVDLCSPQLLEKINHNFDEDFGYEVFLKKAMTAKDVEERKRNEEEKKAKK